jgi:hypothetical protein
MSSNDTIVLTEHPWGGFIVFYAPAVENFWYDAPSWLVLRDDVLAEKHPIFYSKEEAFQAGKQLDEDLGKTEFGVCYYPALLTTEPESYERDKEYEDFYNTTPSDSEPDTRGMRGLFSP